MKNDEEVIDQFADFAVDDAGGVDGDTPTKDQENNSTTVDDGSDGDASTNDGSSIDDGDGGGNGDGDEPSYEEEVALFREELELDENEEVDFSAKGLAKILKSKTESVRSEYEEILNDDEIKGLIEHKKLGGSLETYTHVPKPFDANNYPNETEEQMESNLIKFFSDIKGLDPEVIKPIIADLKNTEGKLEEKSAAALKAFEDRDTKIHKDYLDNISSSKEAEIAAEKVQQEEAEKAWNQVQASIKAGTIGDFKIPKSELEDFTSHINKIAETGQRDLTVNDWMIIDYLKFKNFKVSPESTSNLFPKEPRKTVNLLSKTRTRASANKVITDPKEAMELLNNL